MGLRNLQLASCDTDLLQTAENLFRHALGQIHKTVIVVDIDMADMTAFEPRLVGNGPHNVARLHAVHVAYFDTESLEVDLVRPAALLTRRCLISIATHAPPALR